MALLFSSVDNYTIRVVGRWHRNTIICYLHTFTQSFKAGLVSFIVQQGYYAFILADH